MTACCPPSLLACSRARLEGSCWQKEARQRNPLSSPAEENHYDAAGYALVEVRDILTTHRSNRECVPLEGVPSLIAAGSQFPVTIGAGSRGERGMMVLPTRSTIPAALVVWGRLRIAMVMTTELSNEGMRCRAETWAIPWQFRGRVYRRGSLSLVYGSSSERKLDLRRQECCKLCLWGQFASIF